MSKVNFRSYGQYNNITVEAGNNNLKIARIVRIARIYKPKVKEGHLENTFTPLLNVSKEKELKWEEVL